MLTDKLDWLDTRGLHLLPLRREARGRRRRVSRWERGTGEEEKCKFAKQVIPLPHQCIIKP